MFNTTVVRHVSENHSYHHTEHRAPTDDSVRLLREMEAKAQSQIEKAVRLDGSEIDGVIHKMQDHLTGDTLYAVIFKINGKQQRADFRAKEFHEKEAVAIGVRDSVANVIASQLTASVFAAMGKFQ